MKAPTARERALVRLDAALERDIKTWVVVPHRPMATERCAFDLEALNWAPEEWETLREVVDHGGGYFEVTSGPGKGRYPLSSLDSYFGEAFASGIRQQLELPTAYRIAISLDT